MNHSHTELNKQTNKSSTSIILLKKNQPYACVFISTAYFMADIFVFLFHGYGHFFLKQNDDCYVIVICICIAFLTRSNKFTVYYIICLHVKFSRKTTSKH